MSFPCAVRGPVIGDAAVEHHGREHRVGGLTQIQPEGVLFFLPARTLRTYIKMSKNE
jgi:hypothetical protein